MKRWPRIEADRALELAGFALLVLGVGLGLGAAAGALAGLASGLFVAGLIAVVYSLTIES